MAKETYVYGNKGAGERPAKRPICMAKETYLYGKRDLFVWQKSTYIPYTLHPGYSLHPTLYTLHSTPYNPPKKRKNTKTQNKTALGLSQRKAKEKKT